MQGPAPHVSAPTADAANDGFSIEQFRQNQAQLEAIMMGLQAPSTQMAEQQQPMTYGGLKSQTEPPSTDDKFKQQ